MFPFSCLAGCPAHTAACCSELPAEVVWGAGCSVLLLCRGAIQLSWASFKVLRARIHDCEAIAAWVNSCRARHPAPCTIGVPLIGVTSAYVSSGWQKTSVIGVSGSSRLMCTLAMPHITSSRFSTTFCSHRGHVNVSGSVMSTAHGHISRLCA